MKATGIVRRIDDLGRVVVPKEIRRTLRIREGDPMEIFTDREGEIILKKYSPIGELSEFAGQYAESLWKTTGILTCITDNDHVVAACGIGKKEFEGKEISKELSTAIAGREEFVAARTENQFVAITKEEDGYVSEALSTIICEGDAIGAVILYNKDDSLLVGDTERKLVSTAASFLGRQMEQ